MTCSLRDSYLDETLVPEEGARFEQHLATCGACEAQLRAWEQAEAALQDWAEERVGRTWRSDESQRQAELILARHRERHGQRRRAVVSLALAAAASFFLALLLFGGDGPERGTWEAEILYREGSSSEISQDILSVLGSGRLVAQLGEDRVGLGDAATVRVLGREHGNVQLRLEQGSIGVEAAKRREDETLVVQAGDFAVRVVGTRFRVSRPADGGLVVAVDEGIVEVSTPGQRWWLERGTTLAVDASGTAATHQREEVDSQLDLLLSPAKQVLPATEPADVVPSSDVAPPLGVATPPEPAPPASDVEAAEPSPLPQAPALEAPTPVAPPQLDLAALRTQLAKGQAPEVVDALEGHLSEDPSSVSGWSLLATARRKAGDPAGAIEAHRQVIQRGSRSQAAKARYEAARLLQRRPGGHEEAVELFEALLEDPGALRGLQPEIRLHLSRSMRAVGRSSEADALLQELIATWPGTAAAEAARGELSTKPL